MIVNNFTILELSIAVVSIVGAISLCLSKMKCDKIETPCCKIHRLVEIEKEKEEVKDKPLNKNDFDKAIAKSNHQENSDVIH